MNITREEGGSIFTLSKKKEKLQESLEFAQERDKFKRTEKEKRGKRRIPYPFAWKRKRGPRLPKKKRQNVLVLHKDKKKKREKKRGPPPRDAGKKKNRKNSPAIQRTPLVLRKRYKDPSPRGRRGKKENICDTKKRKGKGEVVGPRLPWRGKRRREKG